jgi:NAD(P)-dependent dehydrogenase (short-subunit alcohol dehydrogenase family)
MVHIEKVRDANERCLGEMMDDCTAVFVPGTTGIGEYALLRLARIRGRHNKGLYVYLVARSQEKAESVIARCKELCPNAEFCFIMTKDIALLSEVDRACQEIRKKEEERKRGSKSAIDILLLSPGKIEIGPRIGESNSNTNTLC